MKGYLPEPDLKTVIGLEFFEHIETPGLGGEIDNPRWKAIWKGKERIRFRRSFDIRNQRIC